ncbi:hypothetical protein EJ08DRAFT_69769 [Tothia fuscella]|uniref:Heterokaryon incompatibility domain-containing protein n=1 Tax=Tothia fuscella TaxID=1048955 RepID=A0A9P4NEL4_9PEZI|nr:hypothetical protein EJ08DRAFT_69769 [Tothia fuscella]
MKVTQDFGVRYIWIDSLCIVQDSLEDWQIESAQMKNVYESCVCNIAATGSSDDGGSLFQERDPCWVSKNRLRINYAGHDQTYLSTLDEPWGRWVSRSSLNRRGWVLQERMLSPRTIHYTSQLFWECRMLQACETYPDGEPGDPEYMELDGNILPISLKNWHEMCQEDMASFWVQLVGTYLRCSITVPSDRLIAVAGIAKSPQPLFDDEYLAGLWKKELPYNLVWDLCNVEDGKDHKLHLVDYRCPTWSWAALDFLSACIEDIIVHEYERRDLLVDVLSARIEHLGGDAFGPLKGGCIQLAGRVGQWSQSFSRCEDVYQRDVDEEIESGGLYQCRLSLWDCEGTEIHFLPLFTRDRNGNMVTECLLLQSIKAGTHEYNRVGVLTVLLNLEGKDEELPERIKWVPDFSKSASVDGFVTVTIY